MGATSYTKKDESKTNQVSPREQDALRWNVIKATETGKTVSVHADSKDRNAKVQDLDVKGTEEPVSDG